MIIHIRAYSCATGGAGGPRRPDLAAVVTIDDVRALASTLPRSSEVVVRDRVKFRVGRIVYLAFSPDESLMGFAFPRRSAAALVAAEPDRYLMPVHRTCATTGSTCASTPSGWPRCASWSSMPGGWWCPSGWRPPTSVRRIATR